VEAEQGLVDGAHGGVELGITRQQDPHDVRVLAGDLREQLDPAHTRHPLVRHHDLNIFALEHFECLDRRARSQYLVGSTLESRRQSQCGVVVIHQEDPEPHRHLEFANFANSSGCARGRSERGPVDRRAKILWRQFTGKCLSATNPAAQD